MRCMNLNTSSCCASILRPSSSPLALSLRFNSSNGTVAFSRSAIMIIVKNSRSVVCEMSTMFAFASASTAETRAMMPTVSAPMTVTMMRFDLVGMGRLESVLQAAHLCIDFSGAQPVSAVHWPHATKHLPFAYRGCGAFARELPCRRGAGVVRDDGARAAHRRELRSSAYRARAESRQRRHRRLFHRRFDHAALGRGRLSG